MLLSIIIPCYNEASRGIHTVRSYKRRLQELQNELNLDFDYEIVIVDDCSTDSTWSDTVSFIKTNCLKNWHAIKLKTNMGKGKAVMCGLNHALGDFVTYIDADMSISPEFLTMFFKRYALSNNICYIGNRNSASSVIASERPKIRCAISKLSNIAIRCVSGINVPDTQCGFKVFSREAYTSIKDVLNGYRWIFDVELLYGVKHQNIYIQSIPVIWDNMEAESRLNGTFAIKNSLKDLLKFSYEKSKIYRKTRKNL